MIKTWEERIKDDAHDFHTPQAMQAEIYELRAKIAELEANERTYTKIIGERSYQEVADDLKRLDAWGKQQPRGYVFDMGNLDNSVIRKNGHYPKPYEAAVYTKPKDQP